MAATEPFKGAIVAAALALPGVLPGQAQAQSVPEQGSVSLKFLAYRDSQSTDTRYPQYTGNEPSRLRRISVNAPSFAIVAPLSSQWAVEGSLIAEHVSGATPRYYSDVSGATTSPGMEDRRTAGDVKLTRYFERASIGVGLAASKENDFRSNAVSLDGRISTDDRNTTLNLGLAHTRDRITSVNDDLLDEDRKTTELMAGVTRVLTRSDIVQLNLSYAGGRGYYSDPYKLFDHRPDTRKQAAALLRWNHHFSGLGSTLRSGYRYYRDSFNIRAHTADLAWVQPITPIFSLTPSVRYYSQSAARFYYDPVSDVVLYPGPVGTPTYSSPDQRLSAFGAITVGLKAELQLGRWATDLKVEQYEQRSSWRTGGQGSPGIDPLHATMLQFGVSTNF
ncbi:DUF3570 domain-containing protein [Variovorax sp. YR752]|uniref:DUF3570 domain-containing protein n=1 Tax=Variovorax sp. YR752 TaxID=1884383 RepID=UPI003137E281